MSPPRWRVWSLSLTIYISRGSLAPMNSDLPATGTVALLELLDPFVPDDFINECWPHGPTGGRHCEHTYAQLFRVHLLCLLSPVHSVNLLIKMLPEQRAWRKFAALRRQSRVPDVRMMHQFRCRVGVAGLRRINQQLLAPFLPPFSWEAGAVSVGPFFRLCHPPHCFGGRVAGSQLVLLSAAMGLVSAAGRGGHGVFGGAA